MKEYTIKGTHPKTEEEITFKCFAFSKEDAMRRVIDHLYFTSYHIKSARAYGLRFEEEEQNE